MVNNDAETEKLILEAIHNAWKERKVRQGYHHPLDCPIKADLKQAIADLGEKDFLIIPDDMATCGKCNARLVPYQDLFRRFWKKVIPPDNCY